MTNFSGIKNSLLKLHAFPEDQMNQFADRLTFKKLKKKNFLIQPNQISNRLSFVNQGSLRFYTHTEQGELTMGFFTENQWVADIESLLMQQPSENHIEALENSDIASITLQDIHELMDIHPCFRMLNGLIANLIIPARHLATDVTHGSSRFPGNRVLAVGQRPVPTNWLNHCVTSVSNNTHKKS